LSELIKVSYVSVESGGVVFNCAKKSNKIAVQNSGEAEMSVNAARAMAQKIIENAKAEAENIRQRARGEAADILEEAKAAGYKEGLEQGRILAQRENQKTLNEIKSVMERIEKEKDRLFAENKVDAIELAFTIAEKIMNQKLSMDEKSFLKIYENAVKDLSVQKWVRLSVSKQQAEFATKNSEYLRSMVDGAERLEIEVLDDAPAGTCIVETSEKIVDAGIQTQISLLRDAVHTA
jgi:flagellar assembly protein FliH